MCILSAASPKLSVSATARKCRSVLRSRSDCITYPYPRKASAEGERMLRRKREGQSALPDELIDLNFRRSAEVPNWKTTDRPMIGREETKVEPKRLDGDR